MAFSPDWKQRYTELKNNEIKTAQSKNKNYKLQNTHIKSWVLTGIASAIILGFFFITLRL